MFQRRLAEDLIRKAADQNIIFLFRMTFISITVLTIHTPPQSNCFSEDHCKSVFVHHVIPGNG